MLSYNPLWKMLIDRRMKKTDLYDAVDLSRGTVTKMGRDEPVSLSVIIRICEYFHCGIGDVVEYIHED
ncbi:MAG: helix-turn-helix domain-containing protein [Blautia sp.]|nr:helix-turn-helix domain-containing protein [Blautia sp.]